MTKVLILGAAGQIAGMVTDQLLNHSDVQLNLLARNGKQRINVSDNARETVFDGDFNDFNSLKQAMSGVDYVLVDNMSSKSATQTIVKAMDASSVKRIICVNILGICNEVPGKFGQWNQAMLDGSIQKHAGTAKVVQNSDLNYTMLRPTWLYNKNGDENYELTTPDQPLKSAQVTRQAVAKLIYNIICDDEPKYQHASLGVGEPNTYYAKPSFY
ncbi:NAD-dependent dehydratase [Philodulcilactobacillus myokoensis]|uniref:NAD-dependent dehydratase n=1 Tax=Philodulcilactobacillus myokoensis TaxID=2929573 RepID=A0A9W6B0M2_9LACO|nr:NAD(P)H-binding protein [Philodulcilactobacillus myokoensis]GLB46443.1 NAD-dependent dehydratase [Philodulcilactobacillus myokoensis]